MKDCTILFMQFQKLLENENKKEAVDYALALLEKGELTVVELYEQVLTPVLNQMVCKLTDKSMCVWKEHVHTAIVRTIVECCYPYIIKSLQGKESKGKAIVICPPEEYHDLGARMAADFFLLCGYDTVFVGSNTPYEDFYQASSSLKPDFLAISVSNYYNLFITQKIIADLRKTLPASSKIVIGGAAMKGNQDVFGAIGADFLAESYEDIVKITEGSVGL
ncbi:MAG: hypothetical protein BGN88_04160 [Clostridiales bacterium 43-6]|nr:MAG: hypothetical protein BGN88_04160 [Clostridiales bacterium 43-6]